MPGTIEDALSQFKITANTYIVAVTRNVLVDRQILPGLLATPTPYIGIIGSRRRWRETQKLLRADGMTDEQMQRFHSPIGLELQAETPEEIAVSIMAEIIMARRGGTGVRMAVRFIPERRLPDKALDVLDEACAEASLSGRERVTSGCGSCAEPRCPWFGRGGPLAAGCDAGHCCRGGRIPS